MTTKTLTLEEARAALDAEGITITQWSKDHGFNRYTVINLLLGRIKGRYGEAHRAAIALGIKADPDKNAA